MKCGSCDAAASLVDRADRLLEAERKVREASIIRIVEMQEELTSLRAQVEQAGDPSGLRERVVNLASQLILERDQHNAEMASLLTQLEEARRPKPKKPAAPRLPADPKLPKVKRLFPIRRAEPEPRPPEFSVEMETVLRRVGCDAGTIRRLAKMGGLPYFYDRTTGNYWFKRAETEALIRERYKIEVSLA